MLCVTSILKGQIEKWVYFQWESNQNLRIQSSEYNSICHWNLNVIENTVVEITYSCLLPLFVTRFESSQALFLLEPPSAFPLPFYASRVSKDFPALSLWLLMGVEGMTIRVSFFWLPAAISLASTTSSPCATAFDSCWISSLQTQNHSPVCLSLLVLPQHHPPGRLAVSEQHYFAPPHSFRKGFLYLDEALG